MKSREDQGRRVDPHIGLMPKVIRLKLFLDIVPSSFADVTRTLLSNYFKYKLGLLNEINEDIIKVASTINLLQFRFAR